MLFVVSVGGGSTISTMKMFKNPYACAFCQDSFSTATCLVNHVESKHVPDKPSNAKNKNVKGTIDEEVKKRLCEKYKIYGKDKIEFDSKNHKNM